MIDSVLLIRPFSIGKKEFPLGLLYVGTALKNKGYNVKIIDFQDDPFLENEIINTIKNSPNIIVGITGLAPHYKWIKQFTLKLKKISPKTKIIVGGHIAIIYELLLLNSGVDYVCVGEGEELFPELIEKINKSQSPAEILGIAYKDSGNKIIKTGFRPFLKSFIIPDYKLIDIEKYLIHPSKDLFFKNSPLYRAQEKEDDKLGVIMFSRGCVGGCNFCYRHLPGFRQGSIDWAWQHLMVLYEKYGIKYFRVDDELFTNDLEWFEALYKKIRDSKIQILFRITGLRVDAINESLLEKLKEIGCVAINYGIESGSQVILNKMNKRTTVEQNKWAIKKTLDCGMQVMAYTMIGYEGETRRTLKETADFFLETELPSKYISAFYTVPLPGTRLYFDCFKRGIILNEEQYLESLASYIEEKKSIHKYYLLNISDTKMSELRKWEISLPWLVRLKKKFSRFPVVFRVINEIFWFFPANQFLQNLAINFYRFLKRIKNI